ncbi:GNAT family N-acetyltransferase [Sphingomonas caseinilyticus]|nr:GNAT family N-acetyltransferase [Sphingomonas caseinilyticus]
MRRVRSADIDAIHAIMSDAETMRFWSSPPHSTLAETEKWLASMIEADRAGESDEFILEHQGRVIGKLGAWRHPEIGFFLDRDYWGRGLASEALLQFINYARDLGLNCLTADVDPRNTACLHLLAKCGFHETGRQSATYVVDGQACDSVYLKVDLYP